MIECESGIQLVDQMEEYFQSLHVMPNPESTDPGILKLESQVLDMSSTYNVLQSAL